MNGLVLSLFPGIGLLDMAFEEAGFCVVRGPDVLWGGDIRKFNPPSGRFDGIIGGPPCQAFSPLAAIVKANGHQPKFGNLIPEFERCISEANPAWFLMENVPQAPEPAIESYGVHSFLLNNRHCFDESIESPATQNRVRRFSFGCRGKRRILMVDTVVFENRNFDYAAVGGSHGPHGLAVVDKRSKRKPSSVRELRAKQFQKGDLPFNGKSHADFQELCRKQRLPEDFDLPSFTVAAKCKAVGNGVPLPMGRAIAKAVIEATRESHD